MPPDPPPPPAAGSHAAQHGRVQPPSAPASTPAPARAHRIGGLLLALLVGVAGALPIAVRGPSCGHDFDFHLQSWLAVRAAWHAGLPVPHWVPAANYGAGEARFAFYPPLSWLLGALLSLALPWVWVPAAFTAVCLGGAAWSMHRLAARHVGPAVASAAAVLYALAPYLLFTAYERTAYGELLAAVWMPLLLGALLLPRLPVARTAMLVAALWYTNAPSAVMGCYLVLFALLFAAGARLGPGWRERSQWLGLVAPLLRGLGALALGCLLAADYLLPAWYQQRWVAIDRAVGPGMRAADSFLFGHTGEPFHDQVLHTASTIAVATLLFAALAIVAVLRRAWRDRRRAPAATPGAPLIFTLPAAIALGCGLLQLRVSNPLWGHLPELGFLQFPWRWLLPASAAAALLAALALRGSRARATIALGSVLYAAALVGWAASTRYQPCDDEDNVSAQLTLPAPGQGFEGTDEYAAAGTDNGAIQQGLPPVRLLSAPDADEGDDSNPPGQPADADPSNPPWKPAASTAVPGARQLLAWAPEHLAIRVHPQADAYAVLRLETYPAWQVRVNGQPCGTACVPREDGLLTVRVAASRDTRIEATYSTTGDVILARSLSAAGLLLLLAFNKNMSRRDRLPRRGSAPDPLSYS